MLGGLLSGIGEALGGLGGALGGGMGAPGTGIGAPKLMPPPNMAPTGAGAPMMNPQGLGQPQGLPGAMGQLPGGGAPGGMFGQPSGGMPQGPGGMGRPFATPRPPGTPGGPPLPGGGPMGQPPMGQMGQQGMGQPPQGGISPQVMKYADAFMGTAHAAGPGDINMTKTIKGAPKGAAFAGGDVQGSDTGAMMDPGNWKASNNAVKGIQQYESYHQKPYWDYKQWSVGYGTKASGPNDSVANKAEAVDRQLTEMKKYERAIQRNIKVPLSQNQYDALVSFVYNVGPGGVTNSGVSKALNNGDYQGAADHMMDWNKVTEKGKKVFSKGLNNRRSSERKLFMQGM